MKAVQTPTGLTVLIANDVEPTGECFTCGVPLYSPEEAAHHLPRCAKENLDDLRGRKVDVLPPHPDPEIEEHWRKVGERMIAEGRLVTYKNEHAEG
jgi:hypothetical protein